MECAKISQGQVISSGNKMGQNNRPLGGTPMGSIYLRDAFTPRLCLPSMGVPLGHDLGPTCLSASSCPDHNDLRRVFWRQRYLNQAEGSCCCRGGTICCESLAGDDGMPSCARKIWFLGPLQLGQAIAGFPQWSHTGGQDKGGTPQITQTTETPAASCSFPLTLDLTPRPMVTGGAGGLPTPLPVPHPHQDSGPQDVF